MNRNALLWTTRKNKALVKTGITLCHAIATEERNGLDLSLIRTLLLSLGTYTM